MKIELSFYQKLSIMVKIILKRRKGLVLPFNDMIVYV